MATELSTNILSDEPALHVIRSSPIWTESNGSFIKELLSQRIVAVLPAALEEANNSLCPAPRDLVAKALRSALALCVPTGFTEGDRKAWLASAMMTLKDIPEDLLRRGVEEARKVADHPAKIVPAIVAEIKTEWARRRQNRGKVLWFTELAKAPPGDPGGEDACSPEQAKAIMEEFGLRQETRADLRRHLGPPKRPTRQDYIELGADPAVLDALPAPTEEQVP